jgi:polar amino acid transport system substrate-binding protein
MALNAENAPYESVGPSGEFEGFSIDLITELSEILGFTYEYLDMEFTGLISSIQTGRCDCLLSSVSITPERQELVDFSDPYFEPVITIISAKESGITKMEDLVGKKVGASSGTTFLTLAQSIENAEGIGFDNISSAVSLIGTPELDALIETSSFGVVYGSQYNLDVHTIPFSVAKDLPYGAAFPKGSEYLDDFNAAFAVLFENGTMSALQEKWFGDDYVKRLAEAQE